MAPSAGGAHVALEVQPGTGPRSDPAAAERRSPVQPWRPGYTDKARAFFLSRSFQSACQLALGQFVVALFVFVKPLYYTQSCLASIFYTAGVLLIQQDNHVGSALFACAIACGHLIAGILLAGAMVMLARAPHVAYTVFLCVFGSLGFLPMAALRARMGPPALAINLGYAFTIVNAQFDWGIGILWTHELNHAIWTSCIAGLGCVVGGCLVLPSLARDEMRDTAADTLRSIGVAISGYASHMLIQEEHEQAKKVTSSLRGGMAPHGGNGDDKAAVLAELPPASVRSLRERVVATVEEHDDAVYMRALKEETEPGGQRGLVEMAGHGQRRIAELLPSVLLAKRLLGEARYEPPFLSPHRLQLSDWGPLLGALESLIMRCAALESILESDEPLLHQAQLADTLGLDVLPLFRLLYAQVAASCSALATALQMRKGLKHRGQFVRLFEPAWALLEDGLAVTLRDSLLRGYWADYMSSERKGEPHAKHLQLRALMYVSTLTSEIMDSMVAVENAVEGALERQTTIRASLHWRKKTAVYQRRPAEVQARSMNKTVRAVRRALSVSRRGADGHDPSTSRRSSGSVHAPPPDVAQLSEESRAEALREWFRGSVDALHPDNLAAHAPALPADDDSPSAAAHRHEDTGLRAFPAGQSPWPTAEDDLTIQQDWHEAGSLLQREGSLPPVFVSSHVQPTMDRPLQSHPHDDFRPAKADVDAEADAKQASTESSQESPTAAGATTKPSPSRRRAWAYNEVEWAVLLVQAVSCISLWRLHTAIVKQCWRTCRDWPALKRTVRRGRLFQFAAKYWFGCSASLVGIVWLSQDVPSLRPWNPLYVIFTMVVILSEKVETTMQKSVFRIFGTVLGGLLGFCAMADTRSATNPYALMTILCSIAFFASFLTNTPYRYFVFLFLITAQAVITCQYDPFAAPGYHGEPLYYYGRLTDVIIGLAFVVAVALCLPWYSSEAALETLGAAFEDACKTLSDFHDVFSRELQRPTVDEVEEETRGIAALERQVLQKRIGEPLATVQTLMQRDKVAWSSGVLATPPVVFRMRAAMDTLLVRLTAVEAMVMQKPIISGRYSESPWINLAQPLSDLVQQQMTDLVALGKAVHELVAGSETGHCPRQLEVVRAAVDKLNDDRLKVRIKYLEVNDVFHRKVIQGTEPWVRKRTPDDAVRWLSYVFALVTCLNKATLVANTVLADPFIQARCQQRNSGQRFLWFGVPPQPAMMRDDSRAGGKPAAGKAADAEAV